MKNTDGTLGINACGVESSGLDDANYLNETIDCETRKNLVYYKQESQPSLVIEKFKNKMRWYMSKINEELIEKYKNDKVLI